MTRPLVLSLGLIFAMLCEGCASDVVGSRADYDATKVSQANASPSSLVQISPGENGGSTALNTIGPIMQTFIDAETGNVKTWGGGVANKSIALPTGGGKFLLVTSQDDASFEADAIYDAASGSVIATGVKITTNVSDPTKASAEAIKTWGPVYVDALKEARAGNTEKYNAVCKTIESTAPGVLALLKAAFGVP